MRTIIDGYNLIFHCGFNGPQSTPVAIQRSRSRLLDFLKEKLTSEQRRETTVVFDAKRLPAGEASLDSIHQEMRIIFSAGYDNADALIMELIRQHSHPKNLVVVSNDHEIQVAGKRRKAITIDCEKWLQVLESSPVRSLEPETTKPLPGPNEKLDWIRIFSKSDSIREVDPGTQTSSSKPNPETTAQEESTSFENTMHDLDDELKSMLDDIEN